MDFIEAEHEQAGVKERGPLKCLSSLLSLNEGDTERALCSRVVAAAGEAIQKGHNIEQARNGRDAFAKVLETLLYCVVSSIKCIFRGLNFVKFLIMHILFLCLLSFTGTTGNYFCKKS